MAGDERDRRLDHAPRRRARQRPGLRAGGRSRSGRRTTYGTLAARLEASRRGCSCGRSTSRPPFVRAGEARVTYAEKITAADRDSTRPRGRRSSSAAVRALTPHIGARTRCTGARPRRRPVRGDGGGPARVRRGSRSSVRPTAARRSARQPPGTGAAMRRLARGRELARRAQAGARRSCVARLRAGRVRRSGAPQRGPGSSRATARSRCARLRRGTARGTLDH